MKHLISQRKSLFSDIMMVVLRRGELNPRLGGAVTILGESEEFVGLAMHQRLPMTKCLIREVRLLKVAERISNKHLMKAIVPTS